MSKYTAEQQKAFFEQTKDAIELKDMLPPKPFAEQEISQLTELIIYHEWRYYVLNDPLVSDWEYDRLYKRLQRLESAFPGFITPNSPTQRVSPDLVSDLDTVDHLTPMLSLDNSYNDEDLNSFDERIKKITEIEAEADLAYCVEPKFDGGTIALVYENNVLQRGATRGNGAKGEDITHNMRAMRSIPLEADFAKYGIYRVELRGEALIRKDRFLVVNEKREKNGDTILANPRNAATGALRVKDAQEVMDRALEAFIYQVGYAVDKDGNDKMKTFGTHDEYIQMLGDLGFKVPTAETKERKVCKNIAEVHDFVKNWEVRRESYDYEIDGMVVKLNNLDLQEKCGYTSHHPRWAIAFKFKAKQATAKLLNVEYQIGKVGSITPVAKLEPVQLAGVTVSSVSLHNEEFIKSKDLRIGDTVLVERAGDVIPYIVKAMEELRDGSETPIAFPTECPSCGTPLKQEEKEAAWRCPNFSCEAQVLQRMIFHVSKHGVDIDGFGESYVERFYQLGWLKTLADFYRLDYDAIAALEGFGKRSAAKIKKSIDKAKKNPLHRLLQSLSVHHLGKRSSKLIAGEVQDIYEIGTWGEEEFLSIKDIGPKVAANVMAFFADETNLALFKDLESLGVNVKHLPEDDKEVVITDGALSGKTILFTGSFENLKRTEATKIAQAVGARVLGAVSSKLDILVVGENAGSKLKKAQEIGTVQILTEAEFMAIVNGLENFFN
jgi:DNA ligase (NAD+)